MKVAPSEPLTRGLLAVADALARYHRHRVIHLERIGERFARQRRVVLVGNHALSLVDPLLFVSAVWRRYCAVPRFMAHEVGWFRLPILRRMSERYRIVPSRSPAEAATALERDRFLMLFPGGASEAALRDYRAEPYRLKWEGRLGFLRLALAGDADVLFVAAVGNDEAYYQSRLLVPRRIVRRFDRVAGDRYAGARVPMGAAALPLPVQITHVVSPPLELGDRMRALADADALAALHKRVWTECQQFLEQAVAAERARADLADRLTRGAEQVLHRLGL
jgi:1-acyl-sn-glycerol-3-phosphate acyltransferase